MRVADSARLIFWTPTCYCAATEGELRTSKTPRLEAFGAAGPLHWRGLSFASDEVPVVASPALHLLGTGSLNAGYAGS